MLFSLLLERRASIKNWYILSMCWVNVYKAHQRSVAKKLLVVLGVLFTLKSHILDILKYFSMSKYCCWFMRIMYLYSVMKGMTSSKIAYEILNDHDFWILRFDFWFPSWFMISKLISYSEKLLLHKATKSIQVIILCLSHCWGY